VDDRFADYDVLAGFDGLSWNDKTREVIAARQALTIPEGVLTDRQLATLKAVKARVCPDFPGRAPTTTLAMLVHRIATDESDGTRHYRLPPFAECWRHGLDAIEAEAQARYGFAMADLAEQPADATLRAIERGETKASAWAALPPALFWSHRLIPDLVSAHWAQPQAWSAMGFGGPASPRGYVRLSANRRDPWEAVEHGDTPRFGLPRRHGGRS